MSFPSTSLSNGKLESELWRECALWLVRCSVLDADHRILWPEAQLNEFAQMLRDGVLLCHLANRLCKGSVDMRDFSPRPQLSQFLCSKNISLFLYACQHSFHMPLIDLFEAWELYKLVNFGKILLSLSRLSRTPVAARAGISGFPDHPEPSTSGDQEQHDHEYYNRLYKHLEDEADEKDIEEDEYNVISDDEGDRIYDHIVTRRQQSSSSQASTAIEDITPRDQREHCIKELLETERNYVEALNMLLRKFVTPLRESLSPAEFSAIFLNLQELAQLHTAFQSELSKAVRACLGLGSGTTSRSSGSTLTSPSTAPRVGEVFMKWRMKLVAYSEYCSRLSDSQKLIEKLNSEGGTTKERIAQCEMEANGGRFRLQDLLSVPMQRVLKYHLLLQALLKATSKDHPDRPSLEAALDDMLDLSLYINEVKRDSEHLKLIQAVAASIVDCQMPEDTRLQDYGRLLKDGELKLCSHADRKVRQRYLFLFDKVILICKQNKGSSYSFKEALVLKDYRIEDSTSNKTFTKSVPKWNYSWLLVHDRAEDVYQLFTKSQEMKEKWVSAIKLAHDNVFPQARCRTDHFFNMTSFEDATECTVCGKLLRGLYYQGYRCQNCDTSVHKECISDCYGCGKPRPPPRPKSFPSRCQINRQSSQDLGALPDIGQLLRTIRAYHSDVMSFEENELIELLSIQGEPEGFWKGHVIRTGKVGLFPAEYVRKSRASMDLGSNTWSNRSIRPSQSSPVSMTSPIEGQVETARHLVALPAHSQYINIEQLESYQWMMPDLTRDVAETLLCHLPNGTFLVRFSPKQRQYVISIAYDADVKHVKIEFDPQQGFYLDMSKYFKSIVELVQHYETHSLVESFTALETTLKMPLMMACFGFAIAQHNFESTAPNMVSIKKGQLVMILSKAGGERGWWKGKINSKIGYFPLAYVSEVEISSSRLTEFVHASIPAVATALTLPATPPVGLRGDLPQPKVPSPSTTGDNADEDEITSPVSPPPTNGMRKLRIATPS